MKHDQQIGQITGFRFFWNEHYASGRHLKKTLSPFKVFPGVLSVDQMQHLHKDSCQFGWGNTKNVLHHYIWRCLVHLYNLQVPFFLLFLLLFSSCGGINGGRRPPVPRGVVLRGPGAQTDVSSRGRETNRAYSFKKERETGRQMCLRGGYVSQTLYISDPYLLAPVHNVFRLRE